MAKKKKTVSEDNRQPDDVFRGKEYFYGDSYICPVCEKEFVFTKEHMYIAKGGHVCSWRCFLDHVKQSPITVIEKKGKRKAALIPEQPTEQKEKIPEPIIEKPVKQIEEVEELW